MDQKHEYNATPQQQQMYQQPPPPANMQYQSNPSNQQLNEKPNHIHGAGSNWTFGFWDCCSPMDTCCMGYWCPCVLFGRTQQRNEGEPNPSGMGMMCCAWYGLMCIGGQGILQAIQRNAMRKQYGIEGSGVMDCLGACFCACCGLVQEEKESLLRKTGVDPKTKQQYQAPQQMMA